MQVGQNKYIGEVTEQIFWHADHRIDFTKHNLCKHCKITYPKDVDRCLRCNRILQQERTDHVLCNQCGAQLRLHDYYVSRKKKATNNRYTCIACALQYGFISKADLDAFQKHKNIPKLELVIECKK